MKIKNLCQNPNAIACALMSLDISGANVTWVDSGPTDLLIFDHKTDINKVRQYSASLKLCYDFHHASADKHRCWADVLWVNSNEPNEFLVIECEDPGFNHSKIFFNNFLWNRSKAYYTNREWRIPDELWYYHGPKAFELQPISTAEQKTRLFLSPNKIGRSDALFRARLADVVLRYDIMPRGYVSAITWGRDGTLEIPGNQDNPSATTVKQVIESKCKFYNGGYDPVHNAYYNETFFSVYVETFETGTTQFVTEKTLDPLIKGHFILPFSTAGFISYLKHQGWKFPDFIDYSYDSITDDEQRFRAFRSELFRLCSLPMSKWQQLWLDNIDILHYNRNQLYNKPYDQLPILEHLL